jgi:hypothetical protein
VRWRGGMLNSSQKSRIKYFKKLAKELPKDLENRDVLYKAYMDHIEKIRKEKELS